jgi:hypothetical protein
MTFSAPYSNHSNRVVYRSMEESSKRHCPQFQYLSEQDAKNEYGYTFAPLSQVPQHSFSCQSEAGGLDIYMLKKLQASYRNEHRDKGRKKYWRTSRFQIRDFRIEQTLLPIPGLDKIF